MTAIRAIKHCQVTISSPKRNKMSPIWIRLMASRTPENPFHFLQASLFFVVFIICWIVFLYVLHHNFTTVSSAETTSNADKWENPATQVRLTTFTKLAPKFRESAITKQRQKLQDEFAGYKFVDQGITLNDLIIERGGQPIRSVILTAWKSDAEFVGSLIEAAHGTFYYSEPLSYLGPRQLRGENSSQQHVQVLKDLFQCKFFSSDSHINFEENSSFMIDDNSRVAQYCKSLMNYRICTNGPFLSKMCKLFPFQAAHITHMRLKLVQQFLDDPKLNVRVLYVVRDPRGTMDMHYRQEGMKPCVGLCVSPSLLCSDLEDDHAAAARMLKEYPDKFTAVRLEDIALNASAALQRIFTFFHLRLDSTVEKSILERLNSRGIADMRGLHHALRRVVLRWTKDLTRNQINDTENYCAKAITQWGYELTKPCDSSECELDSFNPLKSPPWIEMNI